MNQPELPPIEGGAHAGLTNRQPHPSHQTLLLVWAVAASVIAVCLLGVLPFLTLRVRMAESNARAGAASETLPSMPPEAGADPASMDFVAPEELKPPPPPPLPDIFLSDLKPLVFQSGWGQPGINKSVIGKPLRIEGKTYERGLGTHAYGQAVFDIPADARRFVAVVGLDDEVLNDQWGRGSVSFNVFGDAGDPAEGSVLLVHSPVLSPKTVRSWAFDLELDSRFKRIELVVSGARDGNECDHADWVNAGFLK